MWHDYAGDGWVWMAFAMGAAALVVVIGAIWFAGLFIDGSGRASRAPGSRPDARRILDERLARGELDADDYRTRRRAISDEDGRP